MIETVQPKNRFDAIGIFNRQKSVIIELKEKLEERQRLEALNSAALNASFDELQNIKTIARTIKHSVSAGSRTYIQAQSIQNKAERRENSVDPRPSDILKRYQEHLRVDVSYKSYSALL